jgi:hypothetical protein
VTSAINGKRGQAFLREAIAALDSMPNKRLTTDSLHEPVSGEFCTLGVVGAARGMDLKPLEFADRGPVAKAFGISEALAAEIMFENDDPHHYYYLRIPTPEQRWGRMRAWLAAQVKTTNA